jgi:hypothetical protein
MIALHLSNSNYRLINWLFFGQPPREGVMGASGGVGAPQDAPIPVHSSGTMPAMHGEFNHATQHGHTGNTRKRAISVRPGPRVYESHVDRFR